MNNYVAPSKEAVNQLLSLYQQEDFAELKRLAIQMTRKFPDYHFGWKTLAASLRQCGDTEKAIVANEVALKLAPHDAETQNNHGVMLRGIGQIEQSISYFEKAIELAPNYYQAHNNLGGALSDIFRFEEAEKSYHSAILFSKSFSEAFSNLSEVQRELGKLSEAESNCERSIDLNPNGFIGHTNLGLIKFSLGKMEESKECFEQAIKLNEDCAEAHANLGFLYKIQGVNDFGIIHMRRAAAINPNLRKNNLLLSIAENEHKQPKRLLGNNKNFLVVSELRVEPELKSQIYTLNSINLSKIRDPSYGSSFGSWQLFENTHPAIRKLSSNLRVVIEKAVEADIFIWDSFFTIFRTGGGTIPHNHLAKSFDSDPIFKLSERKYSLVYYVEVGDQESSKPGVLELYKPSKKILPTNGMVVIFPAGRLHSVEYDGNRDRIIVGVNFYII